ncbi:MAG: hypothetical protein AAF229_06095 [Pseudomonadota bacterium]
MPARPAGFWQLLLGYTVLDALRRASFVVLLPLYLATLQPDAIGAFVLYNVAAALLATAANLRLDAAMRTLYFDFGDDAGSQERYLAIVFSTSLLLILATTALMLAIGPRVYQSLAVNAQLEFFPYGFIAVATAFANTALAPYFAFLRNRRALSEFAVFSVFLIVANIAAQSWFLLGLGWGLEGALAGALLPPLLLLLWLLASRPRQLLIWPSGSAVTSSLRFSVPLVAFSLLFLLESRLDRFFVERFLGLESLGAYGVLAALLGLTPMLLHGLDASIRPWLYRALGSGAADAAHSIDGFGRLYIGCGLTTLSLIVCAGSMLGLITDDARYLAVRDWVPVGVSALVPLLFTRYWALLYLYNKKTLRLSGWTLVRTVLMCLLLYLLVPRFGVEGALAALFFSQLLNAIVFAYELSRVAGHAVNRAALIAPPAVFLGILWCSKWLIPDDAYLLFCVSQVVLFLATMAVVHRHAPTELGLLLQASDSAAEPARGAS